MFDFRKRPSLLPLSPFEELFNEVLLFLVNYAVAVYMSRVRSPVFEGTKMREKSTEALPRGPGCVSRLRSDSLSESQDSHQASHGSHRGSPSQTWPLPLHVLHSYMSVMSYGEAKSGCWRGRQGFSISLAVCKQSRLKRLLISLWALSQFNG